MKRAIFWSALLAVPLHANGQTWDCRAVGGSDVLVTLWVDASSNAGKVTLNGSDTEHRAKYEVRGLERWWTFGSTPDAPPLYGVGIEPSGAAAYYVRGGNEADTWIARDVYVCENRSARVAREGRTRVTAAPGPNERDETAKKKQQQLAGDDLQRQLAAEADRLQAERAGLLDQYVRMIQDKIERNWTRPLSARSGLDCMISVVQLPTGDVIEARVTSCNGDAAVTRSIEAAVKLASPLPKPPNPTLFERNLNVRFRPEF